MPQRYIIREYEGFTRDGATVPGRLTPLPARTFDQLENMIKLFFAEVFQCGHSVRFSPERPHFCAV